MVRILVCGSREFKDKNKLRTVLDENKAVFGFVTILSGGAIGADKLAEQWAKDNDVDVDLFLPIKKHIPAYYLHRNAEMIGSCGMVIAFWDGESRGTKFVIDYAKQRGKKVIVIN